MRFRSERNKEKYRQTLSAILESNFIRTEIFEQAWLEEVLGFEGELPSEKKWEYDIPLQPWQEELLENLVVYHKNLVVKARQVGLTWCMLYHFLRMETSRNILFVVDRQDQVRHLQADMDDIMKRMSKAGHSVVVDIQFETSAMFHRRNYQRNYDAVYLDEFANWGRKGQEKAMLWLEPLMRDNTEVTLGSTPQGGSIFNTLGQNQNSPFHIMHVPWDKAEYKNKPSQWLHQVRNQMPFEKWQEDFECKFL